MARPKKEIKRGPGRPKGSKNKSSQVVHTASIAAAPAKHRGRPKGSKNTAPAAAAVAQSVGQEANIASLAMKYVDMYERVNILERNLAGATLNQQRMANELNSILGQFKSQMDTQFTKQLADVAARVAMLESVEDDSESLPQGEASPNGVAHSEQPTQ